MKTAEEWLTDVYCLVQNKGQSGLIDAVGIKQIQLDAIKEGAKRSALEVKKNMDYDARLGNRAWQQVSKENMENILIAAEKWTEKDLSV